MWKLAAQISATVALIALAVSLTCYAFAATVPPAWALALDAFTAVVAATVLWWRVS